MLGNHWSIRGLTLWQIREFQVKLPQTLVSFAESLIKRSFSLDTLLIFELGREERLIRVFYASQLNPAISAWATGSYAELEKLLGFFWDYADNGGTNTQVVILIYRKGRVSQESYLAEAAKALSMYKSVLVLVTDEPIELPDEFPASSVIFDPWVEMDE